MHQLKKNIYKFFFFFLKFLIYPQSTIKTNHIFPNTQIGKNTHIAENGKIYRNVQIKEGTYINADAHLTNVTIGKYCSFGRNVEAGMATHPLDNISTSYIFTKTVASQKAEIGNDVYVGSHAIIFTGVKIGDGAVIGTKSIVKNDVPPYAIVAGIPAKIIRYRFSDEQIEKLLTIQWWDLDHEILLKYKHLMSQPELFIKEIEKYKQNNL